GQARLITGPIVPVSGLPDQNLQIPLTPVPFIPQGPDATAAFFLVDLNDRKTLQNTVDQCFVAVHGLDSGGDIDHDAIAGRLKALWNSMAAAAVSMGPMPLNSSLIAQISNDDGFVRPDGSDPVFPLSAGRRIYLTPGPLSSEGRCLNSCNRNRFERSKSMAGTLMLPANTI
nr:hypothetical protein [Desulfobacterales bacterium]